MLPTLERLPNAHVHTLIFTSPFVLIQVPCPASLRLQVQVQVPILQQRDQHPILLQAPRQPSHPQFQRQSHQLVCSPAIKLHASFHCHLLHQLLSHLLSHRLHQRMPHPLSHLALPLITTLNAPHLQMMILSTTQSLPRREQTVLPKMCTRRCTWVAT